jgi:adenosylhomocysteine nucleosidase
VACLGAVVGLAIERTILRARSPAFQRPADLWILSAGASPDRAETLADTLISRGATALLSFGIAGGLDPGVRPGTVVLAREVVLPDGTRLGADIAWADKVASAAGDMTPHRAPIAGADRMLTSADQKSKLRDRTGAVAADMESHGVARAAARRSVPFLVIRAVADPAERALPQSAVAGLDVAGTVRPLATLAAIAADPKQIAALFGVATDTLTALVALWRFAGQIGQGVAPVGP